MQATRSLQSIVLTYLPTATTVSVYLPSYSRHFTNPNSFTTMTEKTQPYLGKGGVQTVTAKGRPKFIIIEKHDSFQVISSVTHTKMKA